MKGKQMIVATGLCLLLLGNPGNAYADSYEFEAPAQDLFGRPTSIDTIYVTNEEPVNTDRSKNAAYIPPVFGSPTSYLRYTGERLTPNLLGEKITENSSGSVAGGVTILPPAVGAGSGATQNTSTGTTSSTAFTAVNNSLYFNGGYLGVLSIPKINLSVKVYQGTDSTALKNGAGHFEDTSIWNGNVAFAGHNRGVNNHFGKIHTLQDGDRITWNTKLGSRTYQVYSVTKIHKDNVAVLDGTTTNILTLVTCVMNQPDYRWCVQAIAR